MIFTQRVSTVFDVFDMFVAGNTAYIRPSMYFKPQRSLLELNELLAAHSVSLRGMLAGSMPVDVERLCDELSVGLSWAYDAGTGQSLVDTANAWMTELNAFRRECGDPGRLAALGDSIWRLEGKLLEIRSRALDELIDLDLDASRYSNATSFHWQY